MKICYLINQYPKVSHSFIRREILEVEAQGVEVLRIALRGWDQPIVDGDDILEQARTRYLLKGMAALPLCVLQQLCTHPVQFARALAAMLRLGRHSDRPLLMHLVCLVEACRAAGWIRAARATHIHAHFGTNSAEVALLAATLCSVPWSFTVHGPEEFDHPAGLGLPQKIRSASGVVAISSYGRSQLFRWADPADWHKVAVVHCGLDASFLSEPGGNAMGNSSFLCIGRLSGQKGQLLLLQALRVVLDRGHTCQVVFAGDGEMRPQIEARMAALELARHVRITGWIDSAQVRRELLAARAMVLPSFAEGLPVVLMEAMALARPVITTYVAGIPELVEHGASGWLVPAGDVTSLADAMIECLQQGADELRRKGEHGRRNVLRHHDVRIEVRKLLDLFRHGPATPPVTSA